MYVKCEMCEVCAKHTGGRFMRCRTGIDKDTATNLWPYFFEPSDVLTEFSNYLLVLTHLHRPLINCARNSLDGGGDGIMFSVSRC